MADWTSLDTNSLLPGEPLTSAIALALEENPRAIAEGAIGAPRVRGQALAKVSDLPIITVSAADTFDLGAAISLTPGTVSTISTSYVTARTFEIVRATGGARFSISVTGDGDVRLLKNGLEIAVWSQSSGTNTRTADVSIAVSDVFVWEIRADTGTINVILPSPTASDGLAATGAIGLASEL